MLGIACQRCTNDPTWAGDTGRWARRTSARTTGRPASCERRGCNGSSSSRRPPEKRAPKEYHLFNILSSFLNI